MIVIRLKGGLGNQMFQYAIGHILSKKNNCLLKIDTRFFDLSKTNNRVTARDFELDIFDNTYTEAQKEDFSTFDKLSKINRIKRKIGFNYPRKYNEQSPEYHQDILSLKSPLFLNGYFQSHKYYQAYEAEIRALFSFSTYDFKNKNLDILQTLKNEITLSVHIRRGDYVNDPKVNQTHGVCSFDYYLNAIRYISETNKNIKLVFFSDDSAWVKQTFSHLSMDKIFVDHNTGKSSWKDMCLMSLCTHNVIANSSFSWWAAWLNANPKKQVIAPKQWFVDKNRNTNDLIPAEWIRM